MKWLLWKDYRNNRIVVIAVLCFLLVPHLLALWFAQPRFAESFAAASFYGFCISQLVVAVIAGNAIAGERVDRSAEFLASLPIARGRILISKLALALAVTAVIWLTDGLAVWYALNFLQQLSTSDYTSARGWIVNCAIVTMTFFCVGWCLSAFSSSTTIAVCGGLVAPLIAVSGPMFIAHLLGVPLQEFDAEPWFRGICLTLAPISFVVGTWYYLRRVEP